MRTNQETSTRWLLLVWMNFPLSLCQLGRGSNHREFSDPEKLYLNILVKIIQLLKNVVVGWYVHFCCSRPFICTWQASYSTLHCLRNLGHSFYIEMICRLLFVSFCKNSNANTIYFFSVLYKPVKEDAIEEKTSAVRQTRSKELLPWTDNRNLAKMLKNNIKQLICHFIVSDKNKFSRPPYDVK